MNKEKGLSPKVFISYSHDSDEHKNWVLQLSTRLRSNGVDVILDQWNIRLGSDLARFMEQGLSKSKRVICICSENYVTKANEGLGGAGYEKQILTAELIKDQNSERIIPLIKNNSSDKKTPIFLYGRVYINFDEKYLYERNYEELLRDIHEEPIKPIPPIGPNPFENIKQFANQSFLPKNEKYVSPAITGIVTFDYSNNNGFYTIGSNELSFDIKFSKASKTSIYLYRDSENIQSIALAKNITEFREVMDARQWDTSSRYRNIKLNEIAVLQNTNGFYALIKVLEIKDDSRGDENDEITFQYKIQTNGSPSFEIIIKD